MMDALYFIRNTETLTMKIQYLGTAAAEGCPALFCQCGICRIARKTGGRNIRTRSQSMIDDALGIDFPADAYMHELLYGLDYSTVHHYLFTHAHRDHFYPGEFENMDTPYGVVPETHPGYHVYGSEEIVSIASAVQTFPKNLTLHALKPYEACPVGRYRVTPLKAFHGTEQPFNYIISDGEKTLLYMHDTGRPLPETLDFIKSSGVFFDLVSLDTNGGAAASLNYTSHMCLGLTVPLRRKLIEDGNASEKTIFVANHFSHNGEHILYDDRAIYEAAGFVMSYDGLTIEF